MTHGQLERLLEIWQARLGLAHWDIELRAGGVDDDAAFMNIQRQSAYDNALISYQPFLLSGEIPSDVIELPLTDAVIEQKLVHELLHCHTIGMVAVVKDDLDGQLHRDVEQVLTSAFDREEERCVDRVARALVSSWPRSTATEAANG